MNKGGKYNSYPQSIAIITLDDTNNLPNRSHKMLEGLDHWGGELQIVFANITKDFICTTNMYHNSQSHSLQVESLHLQLTVADTATAKILFSPKAKLFLFVGLRYTNSNF